MNNPRLATRYAKSLIDLSVEKNQLDVVYNDMKLLQEVCKANPDFVAMLKSPVINSDKKEKIISSIADTRVSAMTNLFIKLLISKTREKNLPEIADAFITQYNTIKHIYKVKVATAVPMSNELRENIMHKIRSNTPIQNIELESVVYDELIGGFTLEMGDTFIDASVLRDLNDVKKQFKSNEYIQSLR